MSQPTLNNLTSPSTVRRDARPREVRECFTQDARAAIGEITPGVEIFGFTKGQFSLMDVLCALLEQTGPARVTLSTWTAGAVDVAHAYTLLQSKGVSSMRWILDRSFPTRQPDYWRALLQRFNPESVRITQTHAKFALVENDAWRLSVRTSMNLNKNRRFENFEISDCPALADYLGAVSDEIFSTPSVARVPSNKEVGDAFDLFAVKGPPQDDITARLIAGQF